MHNIKRAFNIGCGVNNADDQSSDYQRVEEINAVVDSPVAVSSAHSSTEALRQRLISRCQAIIAKASVCPNREALASALAHTETALCSFTPRNGGRPAMPTVNQRKQNCKEGSMQAKRTKPDQTLTKPHASNTRDAKRKQLADEDSGELVMEVAAASEMTVLGKLVFRWA